MKVRMKSEENEHIKLLSIYYMDTQNLKNL